MDISIIIPTNNRETSLKGCLEQLAGQIGGSDEILVINNNVQGSVKKVILGFRDKLPIKYFFEPRKGPSFARNLGARIAKGKILIFLDDDCLVSPRWLEEIKSFSGRTNCAIQGKIIHKFRQKNIFIDIFWFYSSICEEKLEIEKKGDFFLVNSLATGNLILKKEFLKKIGYWFDDKLFPYVGEQEDLSIRLQRAGVELCRTSKAKVIHIKKEKTIFSHLIAFIYRSFFYGRTEGIIRIKYPLSKKIKSVFGGKIYQLEKRRNEKSRRIFFSRLKSFLKEKKINYKIAFFILVILRETLFFLGIIYGVINYKIFVFLLKRT